MKDKLIAAIREVPISGKTYEEYIEAIADRLIAEDYRKASDVAREIIDAADEIINTICVLTGIEIAAAGGKYFGLRRKWRVRNDHTRAH